MTESHSDRIVVDGGGVFYLYDGTICTYPTGTWLKVVYMKRDGRKYVENALRDYGPEGL